MPFSLRARLLLFTGIIGGLLTLFENCSQFTAFPNASNVTLNAQACLLKNVAIKMAAYNVQDSCEDINNYVCSQQTQSPATTSSTVLKSNALT